MRNHHLLPILGALAAALAVSSDASASVSNGGTDFEIEAPTGGDSVWVGPSDQFSIMKGTYVMLGDIDSNGDFTTTDTSFPVSPTNTYIGGSQISAQIVVSSSSARFLYAVGGSVDITLNVRVKFTWSGSPSCFSNSFTMVLSTSKTFTVGGSSIGGAGYDTSTGYFRANASDFTPPNFTTLSCGGIAATQALLKNTFFGTSAGDSGMKFDHGRVITPNILAY